MNELFLFFIKTMQLTLKAQLVLLQDKPGTSDLRKQIKARIKKIDSMTLGNLPGMEQ